MSAIEAPSLSRQVDFELPIPPAEAPGGVAGSTISASVRLPPEDVAVRPAVLVCWPGVTYDKRYWDLDVPGHPELSFAAHMSARGYVVVGADPVGVGQSTGPDNGDACSLGALARAAAYLVRELRERLRTGSLAAGLDPIEQPFVVGIGHSMGAIIALVEQATYRSYDALALLGLVHDEVLAPIVEGLGEQPDEEITVARALETVHMLLGGAPEPGTTYVTPAKAPLQEEVLNGPDLAADILAFDNEQLVTWPLAPLVEMLRVGLIERHAQLVQSPVFLGIGERELVAADAGHRQVGSYLASRDVTVVVQPEAYHCHNFQPNRESMWNRLGAWANEQAATRGERVTPAARQPLDRPSED